MSFTAFTEDITFSYYHDNQTKTITLYKGSKPSAIVPALMFASGTLGNILALFVLIRSSKTHKWKIFYRLVAALVVTDLFGIVATSPVTLLIYGNNFTWVGGQPLCDYFSFMLIFAGLATVFIVGAMSMDRYIAVCFPYSYKNSEKKRRVNIFIACIWIVSILIAFLPLIGLGSNVKQYPGTWCFFNSFGTKTSDLVFTYFYSTVGILIIFMTAILNVVVIYSLCKQRCLTVITSSFRRKDSSASTASRFKRNNIYIMIFLVAIVMVFGTCWTPLMIRVLINQSHLHEVDYKADLLVVRMASFNQILDPWVYILFRKEIIIKVIVCVRRCTKSNFLRHFSIYSIDNGDNDGGDIRVNKDQKQEHKQNNGDQELITKDKYTDLNEEEIINDENRDEKEIKLLNKNEDTNGHKEE
ncbi:hypothetical protein KUTeg_016264, partial [Tegillarca granosa]